MWTQIKANYLPHKYNYILDLKINLKDKLFKYFEAAINTHISHECLSLTEEKLLLWRKYLYFCLMEMWT